MRRPKIALQALMIVLLGVSIAVHRILKAHPDCGVHE